MMPGSVLLSADAEKSKVIFRFISINKLPVRRMRSMNGRLEILISAGVLKEFIACLDLAGVEYHIKSRSGPVAWVDSIRLKKGLLLGALISAILIFCLSGRIFSFEVLTDNENIRRKVMAVLYEEGVRAGKPVSDCDFTVAERAIKKKVGELSWAGISVEGCKVIVDVIENIEKPEYTQKRLPTDLIASENGVIEKIELNDGMLIIPIGSGVAKGDKIVSGKVINERIYYKNGELRHDISSRYTRSIGRIFGTFERKAEFFQPYYKEEKVVSALAETRYSISIFDVSIPLFFNNDPSYSISDTENHSASFFGAELPLSLNEIKLTDYSYAYKPLSKNEAERLAFGQAEAYEKNFLKNYELKNKKTELKHDESGVTISITYTLYGQISEEVEFFIDK